MHRSKSVSDRNFGVMCTVPGLIAVVAFIGFPVGYNLIVSFFRYNNIEPTVFNGLGQYRWLLGSPFSDFWLSLKVSALYSLGTTSLTFVIAMSLTHLLFNVRRIENFFRNIALLPWATPLVIAAFMWKWILAKEGVLNYVLSILGVIDSNIGWVSTYGLALFSAIVVASWHHIPFVSILLLAGLKSIDAELYEAATIDGAGAFQKFRFISLPLNRYQVIVSTALVWMFTFRTPDILFALTVGGPGKSTLHLGLLLMRTIYDALDFGRAAAIGVLMFLVIITVATPLLYYGIVRKTRVRHEY